MAEIKIGQKTIKFLGKRMRLFQKGSGWAYYKSGKWTLVLSGRFCSVYRSDNYETASHMDADTPTQAVAECELDMLKQFRDLADLCEYELTE